MGGISEVDGVEKVDILAVCLNSYSNRVGVQKWLYLGNHWSNYHQIWTQCSWGYALPISGIGCTLMMSLGAHRCTDNGIWAPRMHFGWFSDRRNTKNKERYNLECVDVLPEYSYALWEVSLAMWLEQWGSITLMQSKQCALKHELWVLCQALPPCCEMMKIHWTKNTLY